MTLTNKQLYERSRNVQGGTTPALREYYANMLAGRAKLGDSEAKNFIAGRIEPTKYRKKR